MKRKWNDEQARRIVMTRLTKGDAFLLEHDAYLAKMQKVQTQLATMTQAQLKAEWPELTYDFK